MKMMKKILVLALVASFAITGTALGQQEPPPPGKMKKLSFPKFKEFDLKNGLDVIVVEHHEQPIASIWLAVGAGSTLDPDGKSSLAQYVATLINKGTADKNSDELAEWIESKGGSFNANASEDYSVFTVSILSEYLDTAYQFLSDVLMGATFPEDELEKERKRVKTALEFQLSDPASMADRHFKEVVYGRHPYADQPTVETVEAVTRDDVVAFHKRNYVANNAIMFVVGDVKHKDVKKAAKKYFGDWAEGTPDEPVYTDPPERTAKNISLYHRPGSVQTNLYVGHLGLRPKNEDWPAVNVANKILGGGATGRLFLNLREEKGWTYGAYSTFSKPVDIGYFRATANVRTEVTDSALTEMLHEFENIVNEPVSDEELSDAKSYLIGNFPTTIETPGQIASQIGQIKLLGLDKSYLEDYRKRIAEVGVDDVEAAMKKYVHPDRMAMIAVGDANEIKDVLEPIAAVSMYDIEGNPMTAEDLSVQGTDYAFDTSQLKDMNATYEVKMQEMSLGNMEVNLKRNGDDDFTSTTNISGMLNMSEELQFGGAFEPRDYSFKMAVMGQEMSADFDFADGKATGKIVGQDGPKDVDTEMVQGAFLKATMEIVLSTLPLSETKSFTFPVLDTQTGALQNVKIVVEGEEDLLVPAGSYSTYKVRVKSPDGESVIYLSKDAPHVMVKQEIPAQRLNIQLTGVEM